MKPLSSVVPHMLLIVLALSSSASAQTSSFEYGVGGIASIGADYHYAPIKGLPGVRSCCPEYSSALSFTPSIDLLAFTPLTNSLRGEIRFGFDYHPSTLVAQTSIIIAPNGVDEPALIEHQLTTMRAYLSITPVLSYSLSRRLSVLGGMRAGFLTASSFSQRESLLEPADVTYEDGSRTRFVIDSNVVPDASSTKVAAMAGIRLDIPFGDDDRWHVMPEVIALVGLGSIQSSQTWNQSSIRLGVGVTWQSYQRAEPIEVPPPPPPPPPPPIVEAKRADTAQKVGAVPLVTEAPPRSYTFDLRGAQSRMVDANGKPLAAEKLVVTNAVSLSLYALLNYIFFDSVSAEIPARYRRISRAEAAAYKLESLNGAGTFAIYHDVLNIVGFKLRSNPQEKIVLTGCNSNEGAEKGNRDLSAARAEAIKSYLLSAWAIDSGQIEIRTRDLPEFPSSSNVLDGIQENRRVEITGPNNRILDPIFFTDTLRSVNAASIMVDVDLQTDTAVKSWTLDIYQGTTLLEKLTGKGAFVSPIRWDIAGRTEVYPRGTQPLRFDLEIIDEVGQRKTIQPAGYAVDQVYRSDKRTEKFNMIIFGFNDAEFTKQHERILEIIRPRIQPTSNVTVEGFTDRLGTEDYNLRLSQRRADAVALRLNLKKENAKGYGSGGDLFDNSTPEGRLYSRTVIITIETPLE